MAAFCVCRFHLTDLCLEVLSQEPPVEACHVDRINAGGGVLVSVVLFCGHCLAVLCSIQWRGLACVGADYRFSMCLLVERERLLPDATLMRQGAMHMNFGRLKKLFLADTMVRALV